jgi:ParB-like chromosome segregation protein Spo0J
MFPDLSKEEYGALAESVRREGLSDAIWTHEGEILDGWHRYRACIEAGVEPRFRKY